jgi:hypothetical protein
LDFSVSALLIAPKDTPQGYFFQKGNERALFIKKIALPVDSKS